jgi:hypothetical protein
LEGTTVATDVKSAQLEAAVKRLLEIVEQLATTYPKKRFTLDGRLVGDIGEVLAEIYYDLDLFEVQKSLHDGKSSDGKLVQVKATMQSSLTFGDIPDYYLGLKIHKNGTYEEIYNGPGAVIWEAIKHRKRPKNYLYTVPMSQLLKLNQTVGAHDRVAHRKRAP